MSKTVVAAEPEALVGLSASDFGSGSGDGVDGDGAGRYDAEPDRVHNAGGGGTIPRVGGGSQYHPYDDSVSDMDSSSGSGAMPTDGDDIYDPREHNNRGKSIITIQLVPNSIQFHCQY